MAYKVLDKELRKMEKVANERMRALEKAGIDSPAYRQAQATLEAMGKKAKTSTGRRFSETGKGTRNEIAQLKSILRKFIGQSTSTVGGAKSYYDDVWKSANNRYNLDAHGITKEQYFSIWENLKSKQSERLLSSTAYIDIVETVARKQQDLPPEDRKTVDEIIRLVESQSSVKGAYKAVGISFKDVAQTNKINLRK